jgi:hypothetical protein
MKTLFDETFEEKKKVGNPYHSRSGKYTDKKTAAKELAEKRADVAENKLEYITSCYISLGKQHSRLLRECEQLKTELSIYKSKTA